MRIPRSSRTVALVALGGLAAGAGAALVGSTLSGGGSAPRAALSASTSPTSVPGGAGGAGGAGLAPHGGATRPHGGRGREGLAAMAGAEVLGGTGGGLGGPGRGLVGTVTAVDGSTLMLRTLRGTVEVTTTATTTYRKEMAASTASAIQVGDVVRVGARRPAGATPGAGAGIADATTPSASPVTATAIEVVEPAVAGRVQTSSPSSLTVVGPDGRLYVVAVGSGTRYVSGPAGAASSAPAAGSYVLAEGPQTGPISITGDVVAVLPAKAGRPGSAAPAAPSA